VRTVREFAGLDQDQLGLGGPLVREPDHLADPQHVDPAEPVVPDRLWHDLRISLPLEFALAAPQAGSPLPIPLLKISCGEAGR
jgi:hypothetical protein